MLSITGSWAAAVGGGIVGYAELVSNSVDVAKVTNLDVAAIVTGIVEGSEICSAFVCGHESDSTEWALSFCWLLKDSSISFWCACKVAC